MATLVIIWLLVEMGTDTLLQSLFETNSFGYQMLNTFANYLFYFVFLNAVFLAAYKLTIKKRNASQRYISIVPTTVLYASDYLKLHSTIIKLGINIYWFSTISPVNQLATGFPLYV